MKIRRVLVTLDASMQGLSRVETAAELASDFQAELVGLFVEDVNLFRMAELPFVLEFSPASSIVRRIERQQLQRELRHQSNRMRRAIALAATSRGIPWDFNVVRGSVAAEVLAAATKADLIILGKKTWAPEGVRRLGSTVRVILSQGSGMTMVLQEKVQWKVPVSLIYDGSDVSRKAMYIALHLVRIRKGRLEIIIVAPNRPKAEEFQSQISEELSDRDISGDFHFLKNPGYTTLLWAVKLYVKGPLVFPCGENLPRGDALCSIVNEIPNPVLLVR
ncbi:MAG: universal stress protein [Acidobacteriota bacterium]